MRKVAGMAVLGAVMTLTACASVEEEPVVDETITLETAKQTTMQVERQIAELVPDVSPDAIQQQQEGVLLSCSDDGVKRWTGRTTVAVDPGRSDGLLDAVQEHFAALEGFESLRETSQGGIDLTTVRRDGYLWLVSIERDGALLDVTSGSACIRLAPSEERLSSY
ncbi:hypothetical protein GCM10025874_00760 [Arenivirga flava]|uniref:PepSY domain-containing protein n=3 Tax=Arenivirga flava TaxID=1930060 RepID=A0AA37U9W8_9MICO|nr:hypothetical protein GCM10025874_00760 [Arenivirga flava]